MKITERLNLSRGCFAERRQRLCSTGRFSKSCSRKSSITAGKGANRFPLFSTGFRGSRAPSQELGGSWDAKTVIKF